MTSSYQDFAELYDRLMADVDYDAWADYLQKLFLQHGIPGEPCAVLDCACGTGEIALRLAQRGYRVTGLDCSEAMLRVAAEKARRLSLSVPLVCEDMQRIALHRPVDAITCCCDGVNYLVGDAALPRFLSSAHGALRPKGLLLFDISSRYKLSAVLGMNTFGEDRPDCTYLWQNAFDPASALLEMQLHFFVPAKDGQYRRFDETHIQRAYTREEIEYALQHTGFRLLGVYEALTLDPPTERSERIQFVAERKDL